MPANNQLPEPPQISRQNVIDAVQRGVSLSGANLSGADLSDANLLGADLSDADLSEANFGYADLVDANLVGVDLVDANLGYAKLVGAQLIGANLIGANLIGANLAGADLTDAECTIADLTGADLTGADLTCTSLYCTNLTNVRLDGARGIATEEEEAALWARIRHIILSNPDGLYMRDWHCGIAWMDIAPTTDAQALEAACGTAHCLAGWAQALSRDPDVRTGMAAKLAGSRLLPRHAYLFGASYDTVLALLRQEQAALAGHLQHPSATEAS